MRCQISNFSYVFERIWRKKLVQDGKLRWQLGMYEHFLERGIGLVDTMIKRRINITCLPELKCIREKFRKIENTGHKLLHMKRKT